MNTHYKINIIVLKLV